jgi:hypothetical protein
MADSSSRRAFVIAVVVGLALGFLSAWFDSLPVDTPLKVLASMANAVGPWLIAAYFVGSRFGDPRNGAIGGLVALTIGVTAYYIGLLAFYGPVLNEVAIAAGALWVVAAAVVGPLYGAAGSAWAAGEGRWRVTAVALLSGGLLAEAAYRAITVEAWTGVDLSRSAIQVAIVDLVLAILVPLALLERARWARGFGLSLAIGLVGAAGLAVALAGMQTLLFGRPV